MNKKARRLFFLFILLGNISFSQGNFNLIDFSKPLMVFQAPIKNGLLFQKAPAIILLKTTQFSFEKNNNQHYFHYEIPQGAIFCRMENSLRNTFNIWIKIRAGTDESYSEIKPQ